MLSIKKVFLAVAVFATILFFSTPSVKAATVEELQALIASLTAQITALTQQLAQLQGGTTESWCHTFNKNLKIGDNSTEVGELKTALMKEGIWPNEAVTYDYDEETASYVTAFQEKYTSEVLTPAGLKYGSGYVGPLTRTKLNKIYGCATEPTCQNLWWYDNSTKVCGQKQFCGAYMYYGLQTFSTQAECNASLNSTSPSITVISPNGGQVLIIGEKYDITWQSKGVKSVGIQWEMYNLDGTRIAAKRIALNIAASIGTYSWTIPSTQATSNTYKIVIWDVTEPNVIEDYSDNYFSIVAATPICTDTDGGNDYYKKGTLTISGNSGYLTDSCQLKQTDNSYVSASQCSGSSCYLEETNCNSVSKSYRTFPADYYNCSNGCENGVCKTAPTPSITVTSPNGGESLVKGSIAKIQWTYSPLPPDQFAINLLSSDQEVAVAHLKYCGISDVYQDGTNGNPFWWNWKVGYDAKGEEIANGNYRITVYNCSNVSDESNSYFSIVTATTDLPDLIISDFSADSYSVGVGDKVKTTLTIKNIGNSKANSVEWQSTNQAGGYSSNITNGCSSLNPGQSCQVILYLGFPTTGSKSITFSVDPDNDIAESNETNNAKSLTLDVVSKATSCSGINMVWYSGTTETRRDAYSYLTDTCNGYRCLTGGIISPACYNFNECQSACAGECKSIPTTKIQCDNNSSITVTSPNGGESWQVGKIYDITWSAANIIGNFQIMVHRKYSSNTDSWGMIVASNLSNDTRKYSWTIPSYITAANDYQIEVQKMDSMDTVLANGMVRDFSDNYFSIIAANTCTDTDGGKDYFKWGAVTTCNNGECLVPRQDTCLNTSQLIERYCENSSAKEETTFCQHGCNAGICLTQTPSVTVTSPNGGETLEIGKTYDITWNAQSMDKVYLAICKDNTDYTCLLIGPSGGVTASLGKYSWTVTSDYAFVVAGTNRKIRVSQVGNTAVRDFSNNYFSIVAAVPTCTDTDGGKNYSVKGTTTYTTTFSDSVTDFCSDEYVTEGWCENGARYQGSYQCPNGCQDGACKATSTIIEAGTLSVAKSLVTPISTQIIAGTTGVEFTKISLASDSKENISVKQIQVVANLGNSAPLSSIKNISLWDGSTQIGSTVASINSSGQALFDLSANPLIVLASSIKTLTIKADINNVSYIVSGGTISLGISANGVSYAGQSSGTVKSTSNSVVLGNEKYVYRTTLTASANSGTPSGSTFAAPNKIVMIFDATNNGNYDASLNKVNFKISYTQNTGSATAQANRNFYLYDVADLTSVIGTGSIPAGATIANYSLAIDLSPDYIIPANSTKSLILVGDLSDMGTSGISQGSNIGFSIYSGTDFIWDDNVGSEVISNYSKNFPVYSGLLFTRVEGESLAILEKQLANISKAIVGIMEQIKNLLGQ